MPNTQFSELHTLVRVILQDTDTDAIRYSDSVLNSHLELLCLLDSDYTKTAGLDEFNAELSDKLKALAILKAALNIVTPQPHHFAYKTPVHSVTRKGGVLELRTWLRRQINLVSSSSLFGMAYESFTEALALHCDRLTDLIDDATALDARSRTALRSS